MPLAAALTLFQVQVSNCELLIADAHKVEQSGEYIFTQSGREQITAVGFLNMFIAWETFLENTILNLMAGCATINGRSPNRWVIPKDVDAANILIKHGKPYFDYTNHEMVRLLSRTYFEAGYPYEPHLSAIAQELSELKTIRNACAHTNSSTQIKLDNLSSEISGNRVSGSSVYKILTMTDGRSGAMGTAFETYKAKLLIAAEQIARG